MIFCKRHPKYKGTALRFRNVYDPCQECLGVYLARVSMDSAMLHQVMKFALDNDFDPGACKSGWLAYWRALPVFESEGAA